MSIRLTIKFYRIISYIVYKINFIDAPYGMRKN